MHNRLFIVVLVIYSTLLSRSIPYYPTPKYVKIPYYYYTMVSGFCVSY